MELGQRAVEAVAVSASAASQDSRTWLHACFGGAYAGRRVLVTGHTGFKGAWLVAWLRQLGAQVHGLALPAAPNSHWQRLNMDVPSLWVDLRDADAVRAAVAQARPEIVFHLAAQAIVSEGYRAPRDTFATNVLGLVHLLDALRATEGVRAVVNVTSDKCYDIPAHDPRPRCESDALGGADPYSASKGCAEIVAACYARSFFQRVRLVSARAGNVIGGGDDSVDRLLPDLMRGAACGAVTPVRNPHAVRPWQHVLEPLTGYLRLGQMLLGGVRVPLPAYNFGPDATNQWSVGAVIEAAQRCWPAVHVREQAKPEMAETSLLRLDSAAAHRDLAWAPVWSTAQAIERTVRWYRASAETGAILTTDDLNDYVRDAAAAGQPWAQPARAAA